MTTKPSGRAEHVLDPGTENEQRLAAIYEHANVGIGEVDANGQLLRVNRTACEITGRSREELLSRNIFNSASSDIYESDRRHFDELIAGNIDRYVVEKQYTRGDGDKIWMEIISSAVRDHGRFLFGVRVFQDVTKARLWSEALAENEQRLAATYEHAAIAISEIDAEGRLLRVNEAACAISGYPHDELLGLSVFDLSHPDDRDIDRSSYQQQATAGAGGYAIEKRLRRKDGSVIWVSVASSSVKDSTGRFLYGIRVMQDISIRKRAERVIRESEQRLRQVLEALPAAVYTTDQRGRVTLYNQAAIALSGSEPTIGIDEAALPWRIYDADGQPIPPERYPMAIALKENRPVRGQELTVERPDGTRSTVIPYPTPLNDASGSLVGAVNMLVDITERKQAEARQKALIDELNHRVKNTLATVQSLAAQTLRGSRAPADVRTNFTGRLLALSKAHDQLSRTGWVSVDFRSIVEDIAAPHRSGTANQVEIEGPFVTLAPNAAVVMAMVLHELMTNAVKYGAMSLPSGTLALRWDVTRSDAGRRLHVFWREAGGPPVKTPTRHGFGTRLTERAIQQELKGSVEFSYDPQGLSCILEIPLTERRL